MQITGPGQHAASGDQPAAVFVRTLDLRCDTDGIWLLSDTSLLTNIGEFTGTDFEGFMCNDGVLLWPREPHVGDVWTSQCMGGWIRWEASDVEEDCSYTFTVTAEEQVSTSAGTWDALQIDVNHSGTCSHPLGAFTLARGAGIIETTDYRLVGFPG